MAPSVPQRFPSISHPLSRLGSREALSISGMSRDGRTSVDWSLGSASPQISLRAHSVAGSYLGANKEEMIRSSTSQDSRKIATEEILMVLGEKLRSGNFHSVKKMFRSNDPSGEGKVTKEAFSRILWSLCGYLSPRKISHVLRRMGLDKSAFISFEDLFTYFRRPSTHDGVAAHESESYLHKSQNSAPNRCLSVASSLEIVNKITNISPEAEAEQAWKALKAMAATGKLDFEDLLPPMCFGDGAYIIPGQLRECLQKLDIVSSDAIVARVLRKLEGGTPYAIHAHKFFKHLGLNSRGKLISKSASESEYNKEKKKKPSDPVTPSGSRQTTSRRPKTSHCNETSRSNKPSSPVQNRPKTSMEVTFKTFDGDLMSFVAKKVDGGQTHFIHVVEAKSNQSSGMISKVDLRLVLKNLGFPVNATTLEHFLSKNGLRRKDGMVNYKLLVRRLQTRSRRGTLSKVMRNQEHLFHDNSPPPTPSEGMSASQLESKLIDIFHKEFLSLLNSFHDLDPSNTGLLTTAEFKSALENRFLISISNESWEQFLSSGEVRYVKPPQSSGDEAYIHYTDFLGKFDVMLRPTSVDADDPWVEKEGNKSQLMEHKERYLRSMAVDPSDHTHRHEPRPLDQLEATLLNVFLYKFSNFKKEYDLIVREDFCRVDKEKLDYIFFKCGFVLTPSELSRLWLSLPITRPMESVSMPTILQQVMRIYYKTIMPEKFSKSSRDSAIVSHVLEKIRVPIVTHWTMLKKKLRYLDPMGTSRVEKSEMLQILRGLPLDIIDLELYYLIEMLESRIPGKTNYFRLMEYFVKNSKSKKPEASARERRSQQSSDSQRVYPKVYGGRDYPKQHDYRYPTPLQPEYITLINAPSTPPFKRINVQPGVTRPFKKRLEEENENQYKNLKSTRQPFIHYRGVLEGLSRHTPSTKDSQRTTESLVLGVKPKINARQLPSMGRAMRKEDKRDCGRISVEAFLKILSRFGVSFRDSNDVYKLLSRYDRKLRDEISYEKFLRALA